MFTFMDKWRYVALPRIVLISTAWVYEYAGSRDSRRRVDALKSNRGGKTCGYWERSAALTESLPTDVYQTRFRGRFGVRPYQHHRTYLNRQVHWADIGFVGIRAFSELKYLSDVHGGTMVRNDLK